MTSDWEFYSQNGICIPLPITRKMFPGRDYAFGVLILLNFFLFILIAIGQVFIYWSIRTNRMSTSDSTQRTKDMTIARRLTAVVVSDFLCWFPVGLLGLLSSSGFPIPGQVNIAMAIFVMPTNSALNPFLYTLNVVLERRRRAKEKRLQKILLAKLQAQGTAVVPDAKASVCTEEEAWDQFKSWLSTGLLLRGKILNHVMNSTEAESTFVWEEAKSS
nr:hypothetical protein BaRGS_026869 [Batillaria attramentaria]